MKSFVAAAILMTSTSALAQQGLISVHQRELEAHQFDATSPELIGPPGLTPIPLQSNVFRGTAGPCKTVFGFLPYWESSTNIRWDHLTHLAAFSVEVNANGTLGNDHGWPWTALINTAHANGVKVVLTATLFNPTDIETLITTPAFKNAFFVNIKNKMLEGTTDGINIDFEGSGSYVNHINQFMAELTAYMHTEVPGSEVTIDGPAVNWAGWDFGGLAASCDGIFIMGYAFSGSWSTVTGANAPLTGGSINITDTVLDEYAAVTQTMPEKLILGVPYYGGHWTTTSLGANATVIDWEGSTRFRNDEPNAQTYGRQWDATSQTPWYRWFDGANWNQVWYDDAESLGLKWQLAEDNNLAGVGMWALNYDGTRDELWDEIQARFVDPCCLGDANTNSAFGFADNFDSGASAADWDVFSSSADYTADFAFDYVSAGIPLAPNAAGGGGTGLKFTANNNDAVAAASGVSAFPIGQNFAGDFVLNFDMWMNYNGGSGGGSGSTEHAIAGINHTPDQVIWSNNALSDGFWFGVTGEGGATDDYHVVRGSTLLSVAEGGYAAGSRAASAAFYQSLFASPDFETPGSPGKNWVEVEIRQEGGVVTWSLDGVVVATRVDATYTSGDIMLGYMDLFSSIANPAADNYVVYDNVQVTILPDQDCNATGIQDSCEAILAGDFDANGVVDLVDYAGFGDCYSGPDAAPAPASATCSAVCLAAFDSDVDGDIDLVDFAQMQTDLSGQN